MWLLLAFLSAALLGFYDAFKKKSLRDNAVLPVLFLNTVFSSLIFLPFILISAFTPALNGTMFEVPVVGWEVHKFIIVKSFIVLSSWIFGYFGMFFILLYGWDGFGYDRFLYDRDMFGGEAWKPGAGYKDIGSVISVFTTTVAMTLYIDGVFLIPPMLYYFGVWTTKSVEIATEGKKQVSLAALMANYLVGVFLVGFGSAAISAIIVYLTGRLLGAGEPLLRVAGTDGSTTMHIVSYFIGLPLSFVIMYFTLFKEGRLFHTLIKKMYHFES